MRRIHEAAAAVETYSPAEQQFNQRRRVVGRTLGPILFLLILLWPMPDLPAPAHRLAAIAALMIVLWMTEGLPLSVTALLGPTLAVLFGVAPVKTAFAPFADPIIFLFIGSFILAEAMFVHRLDRRLAFSALASRWVGQSGLRLVVTYAAVACFTSMWMSNTATTAMLFPLGLAVLTELGRGRGRDRGFQEYALAMMLVTSFAASIGGMGTPVGTPPNLIGVGFLNRAGIEVSFAGWMALCVPIMVVMMAFLVVWLLVPRSRKIHLDTDARRAVREELQKLGPVGPGERNVIFAFALTVVLWVGPGLAQAVLGQGHPWSRALNAMMPEAVAALVGALLLFMLPLPGPTRRLTLTWEEASKIDWGIILLFGGGLAIGQMADSTGLSRALGQWVSDQYPGAGTVGLTMVFTALGILLSETASNTAAANVIVPTAIAVATAAGVSPLEPGLGATLGASMGFMMPISTPPNAIVYSSGYIPIGKMIRLGIVLDIAGYIMIVSGVLGLGCLLLYKRGRGIFSAKTSPGPVLRRVLLTPAAAWLCQIFPERQHQRLQQRHNLLVVLPFKS
jgi:sodium-dependent dicarboxylate transporter 2/3/5